jgi:hypothetical protein
MTVTQARIEIQTLDRDIATPELTGLGETIQATKVVVAFAGDRTDHVIVRPATTPFVLTSGIHGIQGHFPDSVVSVVLHDVPGEMSLACGNATQSVIFAAAAAAATVKRALGWDESPSILVRIDGVGLGIRMNPTFDHGGWLATEVED